MKNKSPPHIKDRFRKFLPVVVDIETAGVNPDTDALLEIASIIIDIDEKGRFVPLPHHNTHVLPFEGAHLCEKALAFNKIDPYHPFRFAETEDQALATIFTPIFEALKEKKCQRAVLVGHNAWFDLLFLKAAVQRTKMETPFHAFTCFDTATLAGVFYGQTVLAKACIEAKIKFNPDEAHSAIYDTQKTAELFCKMLNTWETKKGA